MNHIFKLKAPLYVYWLISLALFLLGIFVHWLFFLMAAYVFFYSTKAALEQKTK